MPCAPARSASLACSMLCAVLLVPAPVITVARSPTASTTARTSSAFSASVVVGPSPGVPMTVPLDTLHARDDLVTPGEVRRISRDRPFAPELLLDLGHNRRREGGAVDLGEHAVDLADGVGVPAFL